MHLHYSDRGAYGGAYSKFGCGLGTHFPTERFFTLAADQGYENRRNGKVN